jgi:hypothetical protein
MNMLNKSKNAVRAITKLNAAIYLEYICRI